MTKRSQWFHTRGLCGMKIKLSFCFTMRWDYVLKSIDTILASTRNKIRRTYVIISGEGESSLLHHNSDVEFKMTTSWFATTDGRREISIRSLRSIVNVELEVPTIRPHTFVNGNICNMPVFRQEWRIRD